MYSIHLRSDRDNDDSLISYRLLSLLSLRRRCSDTAIRRLDEHALEQLDCETMPFCTACDTLNIENLYSSQLQGQNKAGQTILHLSYEDLENNAKNGCDNCRTFRDRFRSTHGNLSERLGQPQKPHDSSAVFVYLQTAFPKNGERPIIKFHVQIGNEPKQPGVEQLSISFRVSQAWGRFRTNFVIEMHANKVTESSQQQKSFPFTFRYTEIDHNLGSDQNFRIAQNWISDCRNNHDPVTCPALADVELPTRLIDVGASEVYESMHLIETSRKERGRYLALSHCWGPEGTKRFVTSSQTLSSRLASISLDDMPPNFSDAVIITRRLGFRYLWIDSLCIIQDSKSDWEIESQKMGRIYTNAALTLAAAAAISSDGGMLTKGYQPVATETLKPSNWFLGDSTGRSHKAFAQDNSMSKIGPRQALPPPCRIKLDSDDTARSIVLDPLEEFSDLEENWFRCTVLGPLALRGWCLQEKLLSRRILYYGNRQIYWQCASSRRAADGEDVPASAARSQASIGNQLSDWPDLLSLPELYRDAVASGSLEQRELIETKIYKTWHTILFLYSNRRLSFNTDRLPSLAGMATLIQELTHDRYVAGFWLKYLKVSLLWTHTRSILKEDAPRSIADGYETQTPEWEKETSDLSGPSWSWCSAAIDDNLDFWADRDSDSKYRERIWKGQDVEVVDVDVKLTSANNPLGQVKSGRLVLKGYTFDRWDTRCLDYSEWRICSSLILGFCPHSPWNREKGNDSGVADRAVLWDYWPRQPLSPLRRTLMHILAWLWDVLVVFLWQGLGRFERKRRDKDCAACRKYLGVHILSLLDKQAGRDGNYEIDLWSLVLERVDDDGEERYRRVGIARKDAYLNEGEVNHGKALDGNVVPRWFKEWTIREVVVI